MGSLEFLALLAFPIILAVPVLAVRYFGSALVRGSGADRTIAIPIADVGARAVQTGRLPMVCAKTGAKATGVAEERSESLPAVWFLLVLLGPAGILALAIVWAVRGQKGVHAEVPLSSTALDQIQQAARTSMIFAAIAGVTVVVFAVALAAGLAGALQVVFGIAAIGALCGWMYTTTKARMSRVRLRVGNPDTLVQFDGVHPDFVAAVQKNARKRGLA